MKIVFLFLSLVSLSSARAAEYKMPATPSSESEVRDVIQHLSQSLMNGSFTGSNSSGTACRVGIDSDASTYFSLYGHSFEILVGYTYYFLENSMVTNPLDGSVEHHIVMVKREDGIEASHETLSALDVTERVGELVSVNMSLAFSAGHEFEPGQTISAVPVDSLNCQKLVRTH